MDDRLRKEREALQEFKSQIEFSEKTSATTTTQQNYLETVEYLRTKDASELGFLEGATDYAAAMALVQINLEKKIAALETEIARNAPPVTINSQPAGQEPPPAQRAGKWQSVKRWFKKTFSSSPAPRQEVAQPVTAQPVVKEPETRESLVQRIRDVTVPSQVNSQAKLKSGADEEGVSSGALKSDMMQAKVEMERLESTIAAGNAELKKKGLTPAAARQQLEELKANFTRAEERYKAHMSVLSPSKLETLRRSSDGPRGTAGDFMAQWSRPVVQPVEDECALIIKQMDLGGFDYAQAMSLGEKKRLPSGKEMPFNPVVFEFSAKMLSTWKTHLQTDAAKEYLQLFYDSFGTGYASIFPPGEENDITNAQVQKRVREIMPTKGLSPMAKLIQQVPPEEADKRSFMLEASRVIAFLPLIKTNSGDGPVDPMLKDLFQTYNEVLAMIEEKTQETCNARVAEMNAWRKANPNLCKGGGRPGV